MSDINTLFQNGVTATVSGGNLIVAANPDNATLNVSSGGQLQVPPAR